ncbi:MAG: stage III sporulation protein AE [Lachnospiraceae bacterium]|nr:stage III sporulation protein AE [Lachnospiraceae bacterium]
MELTDLWEEMRMGELGERISEAFPSLELSLDTMLGLLMQGRFGELWKYFWERGIAGLTIEESGAWTLFVSLVLLGAFSAALMRFSDTYEKYQVSEMSFYLAYLLQAAILARCFSQMLGIATAAIERIVGFIKLLMPVYLVSVSVATGSMSAGASHQMTVLLLLVVEEALRRCFLPLTSCFFLLTVLEGVMGQERLERMTELLKKAVSVGLKGLLGAVAGMGFLQKMLAPAVDKLQGSALMKGVSAIPGIGDGVEGVLEIILGSATIVKNAAGIVMTVLLFFLCLKPLWELLLLAVTLRFAAAVMGIICDKRLAKSADRAGEAGMLLLGIAGVTMLFFEICLAVAVSSVRT